MLRAATGSIFLWLALGLANAATTTYNVNGSMAKTTNTCFNIAVSLTGRDCSYSKTRFPPNASWEGPIAAAGFYAKGSNADITDPDQVLNGFSASPGDGKISLPLTGTVTIDDNGTPANGGGVVNFSDLATFRSLFGKAPGPSGLHP